MGPGAGAVLVVGSDAQAAVRAVENRLGPGTTRVEPTVESCLAVLRAAPDPEVDPSDAGNGGPAPENDEGTGDGDDAVSAGIDCVVLLDGPELNAVEAVERVRSVDEEVPVVLLAEGLSEDRTAEALATGATDVIRAAWTDELTLLADRVERGVGRRRRERQRRETTRKVEAIHGFATAVADCETIEDVCRETIDAARDILAFDRCTVSLVEDGMIHPVAASADLDPDEIHALPVEEGVAGKTVRTGETIIVEDAFDEADAEPAADEIRGAISVPIGDLGVLQATSFVPGYFDERDAEFAELLVAHTREAIGRVRREQQLREERDRLAALFENLPEPAVRVEAEDGISVLRGVNEAFEETFGYDEEELLGGNVYEFIAPDDAGFHDEGPEGRMALGDVVDTAEPVSAEVRRQTVDGVRDFILDVVPVETTGGQSMAYGIYTDIGEQKRAARALHRLHEATRKMINEDGSDAIARLATAAASEVLDVEASGVRLARPGPGDGSERATGGEADATEVGLEVTAVSPTVRDRVDLSPIGPGEGLVWECYADGEVKYVSDTSGRGDVDFPPTGSLLCLPLGEHGVLLLSADEVDAFDESERELARVLAANTEVALDRARRSRLLHEREAELERQNERLERFASVVSHDLRSPLSVARGYLDLAEEATDGAEKEFDRVGAALDRMERLVEDLLTLAREGQSVDEREPVDLGELAERAWRTVDTLEASLAVEDPPTVSGDPDRLRTVFENLFRNAVEHGGDGVTVTVGALDDGAGFYVEDDGTGFEDGTGNIFEYGFTTHDGGTGFGLAIVAEVVEAHGWTVEATESEAGGARFEIRTEE